MTQWVNFLKRETRVKGQFGHRPSFFLSSLSDGHARRAEALAQLDRDAGAHQPLRPRGQQLHQHPHIRVQGWEVPKRPLGKWPPAHSLSSQFSLNSTEGIIFNLLVQYTRYSTRISGQKFNIEIKFERQKRNSELVPTNSPQITIKYKRPMAASETTAATRVDNTIAARTRGRRNRNCAKSNRKLFYLRPSTQRRSMDCHSKLEKWGLVGNFCYYK